MKNNNGLKTVLGLDLGTNSIGWALVEINHVNNKVKILGLGSRILPMDAGEVKKYKEGGKIKSTAALRTEKRGPRRLNERYLLRRDRLHLVLNLLEALPKHYKLDIDFTNQKGEKCGQFKKNKEPKLAYLPKKEGQKAEFLFMESYLEMLEDIGSQEVKNKKGKRIPYDWTLYYLRQKALEREISMEELAWVLLSYNQKRGYEKTEVEDKSTKENEIIEELDLRVKKVISELDKNNERFYEIHLEGNDNFIYREFTDIQMTFPNDLKEVIKVSKVDEKGNIDEKKTEFTVVDIYQLEIKKVNYENVDGKHKYTLVYQNSWEEIKQPKNYTFRYKNALHKSYNYIVETTYDNKGNIKMQQGKDRKLREPDLSDNSSDWTLLKKKTEKEALKFNIKKGYKNYDGSVKEYISPKIYDVLKNDARIGRRTKIIGGMFQVVDRDFYREELKQIIDTQRQFHTVLKDKELFDKCVYTLYPRNGRHRKVLMDNKGVIQHLLVEDILLYQRDLKTKKSEIANCKHEIRYFKDVLDKNGKLIEIVDESTGEIKTKKEPIFRKVVSVSHPYFQEFRIWDKLHNLKLIQLEKEVEGKKITNQDVTKEYFKTEKEYQELFEELNNRKSLNQDQFLAYCKKKFKIDYKKKNSNYVWNFPEDEEIKGNETRVGFATRFKRCGFKDYEEFLTQKKEWELWHYLYSVSYREKTANSNKSVTTFFNNYFGDHDIDLTIKGRIISDFANHPKFASRYCSYSEKALKKLIPLIQKGKNNRKYDWEDEAWYKKWKKFNSSRKEEILKRKVKIDFTKDKIEWKKFTNVDAKVPFPKGLFKAFQKFEKTEDFRSLNLTQASYLVYGRHSELTFAKQWKSPKQIREELHQELKQHSLNNPVAEKVLLEMMQVVADIWEHYGEREKGSNCPKKPFNRIHLEVGRELKKSVKEKESDASRMSNNRAQNKRIRQVLEEFLENSTYGANPRNPDHFERLKIAEESASHTKNIKKDFFKDKSYTKKDIDAILKKPHITKEDFQKYKLWIEQGYRSPYSGQIIKLTDLFNGNKYNVDHIFPRASVTNNSLSNKVVVEVELNNLKSNRTARAFIQDQKGKAYLGTPVCTEEEYVSIVKAQFSGTKRFVLLSKDIPKGFTNSQMNNTRHIARKAMELLSHIVREKDEVEFRSKNVLPVAGRITSQLKREWKLNEVWKELVTPRYIRMNKLTQSNLFGDWQVSKNGEKYFDCNLDNILREKDDSYDIKRIDHRHHALDALIVALCTEEHVHYLNNINANKRLEDFGAQKKLEDYRLKLKRKIKYTVKDDETDEKNWRFMLPGERRVRGAENSRKESVIKMSYFYKNYDYLDRKNHQKVILAALEHTIVTFKQNLRVINNRVNYYQAEPNTKKRKAQEPKTQKDVANSNNKYNWGIRRQLSKETIYGKRIKNGKELRVEREYLNEKFNRKKIRKITDAGVRRILSNHLKQFDTVKLPFDKAINYFNELLEKETFQALIDSPENDLNSINDLVKYVRENNYELNKIDYKELNVFINKISDRDFRNEKQFKENIFEHPEIAFTAEIIDKMNVSAELKRLNEGKHHTPIRKVQTYQIIGKERALSENTESVKSKQYVVTAAGSNLYLGFYERVFNDENGNEIRQRKFKDIGLIELIATLKQDKTKRLNPLPDKIYNDRNEYSWKFTLSPLDLVYVPTDEEIENSLKIDFNNLTKEQISRIYKYVDGSEDVANFIPFTASMPIWRFHGKKNKEIYKELNESDKIEISQKELIQNEFGLGSQQNKNQNMIDGKTQIKKTCIKIEVNRLGILKEYIK